MDAPTDLRRRDELTQRRYRRILRDVYRLRPGWEDADADTASAVRAACTAAAAQHETARQVIASLERAAADWAAECSFQEAQP